MRGSGNYDRKKKDTVVCLAGYAVVLVFGSGGKLAFFLYVVAGNFDYNRKKRYSHLLAGNWQFFCCGGKFSLRPEKKDTLRPEKKRYNRLSDGCAVLAITNGKKNLQSSV